MAFFAALLGLAVVAPALPPLVTRWQSPASPPHTPRRRVIGHATLAGSLGILPAGFLFTLAAYGDWIVLLLICMLGGTYGALVGASVSWLRTARHRGRTG